MSFWDLNRDGKVGTFERGVQLAFIASLISKRKEPDAIYSSGSYGAGRAGKANEPVKPSRLDGAIGVFGFIAGVSTVLVLILGFSLAFSDFDTSGMSYEEAIRAIDLRYIPAMVCSAICAVSWIVALVLVRLSRHFPAAEADDKDGAGE